MADVFMSQFDTRTISIEIWSEIWCDWSEPEAAATMEHIQRSIHDVLDIHRKQVSLRLLHMILITPTAMIMTHVWIMF